MACINAVDGAATSPVAEAAVNAFATFADSSNVPAVTELSKTLQAFQQRLKYSKYCKKECTALANKCGDWAQEFEEWAKAVDNTELAHVASEQSMRFEDMMLRVTKISSRSRWKLLWGAEKVKRELNSVEDDMKHLHELFKTRATMSNDATADRVLEKGQENLALTRELKADLVQARVRATPSGLSKSEGEQMWKEFEAQAGRPSQVPTPNAAKMDERDQDLINSGFRNITLPEIRSAVADYEKRTGVRSVVPDLKDEVFVIKASNGEYQESTGNARTQIHIGNYKGRRVAVRRYVVGVTDIDELRERFLAEILIWGQLNHSRIHHFFGVTNDTALAHTVIVSEWEDNGNAADYTTKRPGDLAVRLRLLIGAAEGLIYLHGLGIVHGNLKGRNILVSNEGEALITGFQRAKLDADTEEDKVVSTRRETDQNWTAPDLADAYRRPCAKLDVWAFGMIMYELLSGRVPYHDIRGQGRILKQITIGVLPERPLHALVTDELWELMGDTWNQKPEDRPNMEQVLVRLRVLQATNDLQNASP
ncbi:uncharacterized protein PHACADRAFT_263338 [Phanerochaete carnosa HHB-10118-sp]|uniref:Protein kinase domain-containing protein n=1 Tax=Phanerochaete carnosa (strain HHB-10118-sp) TaxID=650164 RepID=K5VXJ9_PHACS|nr:uncharacterized protein PHACADRAFT_263338 [Phanerochaete carnosa HHB-10118-sp]EKM51299.1 hypothetical protein PHACADRAFT_263338 [Phanerochaete carnosa HHB-10118-sp]